MREAELVMYQMQQEGIKPSLVTYNVLMEVRITRLASLPSPHFTAGHERLLSMEEGEV